MDINSKHIVARQMLVQYLKDTAEQKHITHQQIADKTGFTRSNISRMLLGKYSPSVDSFLKLADAIGVYFFIIDKDNPDDDLISLMKSRWKSTASDN